MARGRKDSVRARPARTARRRNARGAQVAKPARKAAPARKRAAKPKTVAGKAPAGRKPRQAAGLESVVHDLTAERDRLKAELHTALKRLQRLESSQREVTERIDKAISSIHNVLDTRN